MKKFFIMILAGAAMMFASCGTMDMNRAATGAMEALQAMSITDEQMAAYVQQSVAAMDKQNKVLPESSPYVVRLRRLTKGITDADGIPLNFKVYQTSELNAFACPDGSVRVYTGIMDRMNDDELMGIIGHEVGHVIKRHSRKAFQNQLLSGALRDVVGSTGGVAAVLTDSQLYTLGQALGNAKYSQKQESEADDCGYDFLVANGRNPWGMVHAFQKLEAVEQAAGQQSDGLQRMFSSHPDTAKRIAAMEKRCRKDGYAENSSSTSSQGKSSAIKHAPKTTKTIRF